MVDKFWPQLERDFARQYQIRAMDWFEGKRDWREFYRLKQGFVRGSETHTAMADDPEVAQEIAEYNRKHRPKPGPPSPIGFNHDLADIKDHLIAIAFSNSDGKTSPTWTPRPEYESDRIQARMSKANSRRIQAMLVPHDNIQLLD